MGAVVANVQTILTGYHSVLEEMTMALEVLNQKNWEDADLETAMATADSATFGAIADAGNDSNTRAGTDDCIDTARFNAYFTAAKVVETGWREVQIALRRKEWVEAVRLLTVASDFNNSIVATEAARTTARANPDTTQVGANIIETDNALIVADQILANIKVAFEFRANKQYSEVERVLRSFIVPELALFTTRIAAITVTA